jgi:hypothetical protein
MTPLCGRHRHTLLPLPHSPTVAPVLHPCLPVTASKPKVESRPVVLAVGSVALLGAAAVSSTRLLADELHVALSLALPLPCPWVRQSTTLIHSASIILRFSSSPAVSSLRVCFGLSHVLSGHLFFTLFPHSGRPRIVIYVRYPCISHCTSVWPRGWTSKSQHS